MRRNSYQIRDKKQEAKAIYRDAGANLTSRDFEGKELAKYLLWPFTRALFGVGCIFLDLLVVPFLYEVIPPIHEGIAILNFLYTYNLLFYYILAMEGFLFILLVILEIRFYKKRLAKDLEREMILNLLDRKSGKIRRNI